MTTATKQAPRVTGTRTLVVTMVAVDLVVLAVALLAAVVSGGDAAVAALVGGFIAAVVLFTGTVLVNLVASLVPAAALLVALLTYVLQVVVLALVFVGLSESALVDDQASRTWLGTAVIAATLAWLVAQVVVATRARIPAYDLPLRPDAAGIAEPGPSVEGGGER
jgi:hypothetical protein